MEFMIFAFVITEAPRAGKCFVTVLTSVHRSLLRVVVSDVYSQVAPVLEHLVTVRALGLGILERALPPWNSIRGLGL